MKRCQWLLIHVMRLVSHRLAVVVCHLQVKELLAFVPSRVLFVTVIAEAFLATLQQFSR
jgi:hypothetical protein